MANGREGKIQTIRIYLRHHNDPEGKFTPVTRTCQDNAERGIKGCGMTITRYMTYPNQKGMYFDSAPKQVGEPVMMGDGAVIAVVQTDNVHFATCPARKPAAAGPTTDFRQAQAGGAK